MTFNIQDNLIETFDQIDVYLFDQLLKGRFDNCHNVLDVGCGGGRNLVYLSKCGLDIYGVDQDQEVLDRAISLLPNGKFECALADKLNYVDNNFDVVICNAVLHFAQDDKHFQDMLNEIWRVIKPGGFLFARLASSQGIEDLIKPLGNNVYDLPDGSKRYLINDDMLLKHTDNLKAQLLDPIKTTNVQSKRCMSTWVIKKI